MMPISFEQPRQAPGEVMLRTQVYLTASEAGLLERAERSTGAARSDLVRRAIRLAFGDREQADRLVALRASAGVWGDRAYSAAEYLDAIRSRDPEEIRRVLGGEA